MDKKIIYNEKIKYQKLRVIDDQELLGILTKEHALEIAYDRGLDLVIVADQVEPPVAKILDLKKHLYEQKRKHKENSKKQRDSRIDVKEVQFRPNIGEHDFNTKLKNIQRFISRGDKVKCIVKYRGRENINKQAGFEVFNKIIESLSNVEWEVKPALNGNRLIGILKRGKNE